jgi:hypothetical protein
MRSLTLTIASLVASAFISTHAIAQEWKPEVDTSKVTSYKSFKELDLSAYKLFIQRDNKSYAEYVEIDRRYFKEFREKRMVALMEFRSSDRPNYVEWLDAREVEDSAKEAMLDQTIPALKVFRNKQREEYKRYEVQRDAAYETYKAKKQNAWDVYQKETESLNKAYLLLPSNKQ